MNNKHKIDDVAVIMGQCIRVKNVEKENDPKAHRHELNEYVSIQVEDYSGDNEYCILLTHLDHTDMESVIFPMYLVNSMVAGRLYPVTIAKKDTYLIKVVHWDGRTRILRISPKQLQEATDRAICHPLSCTKKSFIRDLID